MAAFDRSLVWFRRDLRAFDHAALHQALTQSRAVYCAFVFDTDILDSLPRADRRVEFIHASLIELDAALCALGGGLIVRHGRAAGILPALADELKADAVFTNEDYEPHAIARDAEVAQRLKAKGKTFLSYKDQVVFEKDEVLAQSARPFTVFTPYKNAWLRILQSDPALPAIAPCEIESLAANFAPAPAASTPTLEDLGFAPTNLQELALPTGMSGAQKLLDDFAGRMEHYGEARNFPALKGPSYLSVHLRFGTISIRGLARRAYDAMRTGEGGEGASVWLSELIWRDFYAMILYQNPHVAGGAFKREYDAIAWETGALADAHFAAWCEGRTGYPLVDAAMQQINRTGYMHNRLRMVVASFLVKDLGIDWRRGERYFAEKLIDFDLASNNGGWQWAASSGCDAQPYFRIFNPVTQSEGFDADGKFIKRYLPQLGKLTKRDIHAPWKLPADKLKEAGIVLGRNYPWPIVDHDTARKRTLARYQVVRKSGGAEAGETS